MLAIFQLSRKYAALTIEFNFDGLHPVFVEAVRKHEPSIAFALQEGPGRFVFLLFLATNSKGDIAWGKLELFILLGRTQRMLRFDLFGNHFKQGDFRVWLNDYDEQAIRDELGITDSASGPGFVLKNFLTKLNGMIPATLPLSAKIDTIKGDRAAIDAHCRDYIEEASKVYLLGVKRLPKGSRPREETLRKLYMLDVATADISALIGHLKRIRWTVCWTDKNQIPTSLPRSLPKSQAL